MTTVRLKFVCLFPSQLPHGLVTPRTKQPDKTVPDGSLAPLASWITSLKETRRTQLCCPSEHQNFQYFFCKRRQIIWCCQAQSKYTIQWPYRVPHFLQKNIPNRFSVDESSFQLTILFFSSPQQVARVDPHPLKIFVATKGRRVQSRIFKISSCKSVSVSTKLEN